MKIKKGFVLHSVAGEYIIIQNGTSNVDFGRILSLNSTAVYLWEQIGDQQFDTDILAHMLMERYRIAEEDALRDAEAFVEKLKVAGVVTEEE